MPARLFGMQEWYKDGPKRSDGLLFRRLTQPPSVVLIASISRRDPMMKRSLPRLRTVSARPQSIVITPERSADASLASDIAKRLEEEILRGRARPGARLDERELSERYKVSRTPVREALQRLSARRVVVGRR